MGGKRKFVPDDDKPKQTYAERLAEDREVSKRAALSWVRGARWLHEKDKLKLAQYSVIEAARTLVAMHAREFYGEALDAMNFLASQGMAADESKNERWLNILRAADAGEIRPMGEPIRTPKVVFEIVEEVTDDWRNL